MARNRGVTISKSFYLERKFVMKKVISIVLAIALVLSMSVCAFAAVKPTDKPATAEDMGMYYATLLNEGATKDDIIAEFISDLEEGYMTDAMLTNVAETFVMNSDDQALAMEIVDEITAYLSTTTTTGIGDIIGGVIDGAGDALGGVVEDASDALGDLTEGSGSFLDTILGVLGSMSGSEDVKATSTALTPYTTTASYLPNQFGDYNYFSQIKIDCLQIS